MTERRIARNLPHLLSLAEHVEERVEGVDVSVVGDVVMMSPVPPAHFRTQREVDRQLCEQVGDAALVKI
ncbi:hypothetical protein [Streptomyces sp. NPDC002790]|uniref:hypothetical protein n=1 Tax=Streptomyces sp. NPDC002790 TaxID=3154431 RepID=UPI00331A6E8D